MLAFSLALPRVAPLAARPARQLSIAAFAVKFTISNPRKAKRLLPQTAPPSTLVSKHLIFQKEKRTAWVRFSFWSSFCFIIRTFVLVKRYCCRAVLIVENNRYFIVVQINRIDKTVNQTLPAVLRINIQRLEFLNTKTDLFFR